MIGIPALDSLSTWELIQITWKNIRIEIPQPTPLQTSLSRTRKPQLQEPIKRMSQDKIITLCRMEIELRFKIDKLRDIIESSEDLK